jgi:hypothetical protein
MDVTPYGHFAGIHFAGRLIFLKDGKLTEVS